MLIEKSKLFYISLKLFLLGKGIRRTDAKLARITAKELSSAGTVQLALKAERMKAVFAQTEEAFFRLLFAISRNIGQKNR